jgi:hypothetical protein
MDEKSQNFFLKSGRIRGRKKLWRRAAMFSEIEQRGD